MESHSDSDAKALPATSDNTPHHHDSSLSDFDSSSVDEGSSSMKRGAEREQLAETNGQGIEGLQNIETVFSPHSPTAEIIEANSQLTEMSNQHMDGTQSIKTGFPPGSHMVEIIETSGQHADTNGQHTEKNGQHNETNDQQIDSIGTNANIMTWPEHVSGMNAPSNNPTFGIPSTHPFSSFSQQGTLTGINANIVTWPEHVSGMNAPPPNNPTFGFPSAHPSSTFSQPGTLTGPISGGNNRTGGAPIQPEQLQRSLSEIDLLPGLCSLVFPNYPWGMYSNLEQNPGDITTPFVVNPLDNQGADVKESPFEAPVPKEWPDRNISEPEERIPELPNSNDSSSPSKSIESNDIIKSIVYGGLDISIRSFGVISSASGGKSTTRTIVYMGFATLLAGLIMFFHMVVDLFYQNRIQYRELVGKTLRLNGTIALVSYLFFGMLAPLTYALTFWDLDDRDYKFFSSAVISLVSVVLLSTGKSYIFKKPYRSTVSAYAVSGVLSGVVGYLTGQFLTELLEKWGIKDISDPDN